MGRIRRTLGLTVLATLVAPLVAARVAQGQLRSTGDELSDEIGLVSIFDGTRLASRAQRFRGGTLLAWYSGTELDLSRAELDPAGARLSVTALFAGVEIRVPMHWRVRLDGPMAILAGIDAPVRSTGEGPELVIEPRAFMSGVQVTMRPPAEEAVVTPPASADLSRAEEEAASLANAEAGTTDVASAAEATISDAPEGALPVETVADEERPAEG